MGIRKLSFFVFFFLQQIAKDKPCRGKQSRRTKSRKTKATTLAEDDELVHVRKANRGRNPEPEVNPAERRDREADPRARSAENRGANQDVAPPPRGPSPSAAAASPDAAPPPRAGRGPSPSVAAASPDAAPSSANARRRKC